MSYVVNSPSILLHWWSYEYTVICLFHHAVVNEWFDCAVNYARGHWQKCFTCCPTGNHFNSSTGLSMYWEYEEKHILLICTEYRMVLFPVSPTDCPAPPRPPPSSARISCCSTGIFIFFSRRVQTTDTSRRSRHLEKFRWRYLRGRSSDLLRVWL